MRIKNIKLRIKILRLNYMYFVKIKHKVGTIKLERLQEKIIKCKYKQILNKQILIRFHILICGAYIGLKVNKSMIVQATFLLYIINAIYLFIYLLLLLFCFIK